MDLKFETYLYVLKLINEDNSNNNKNNAKEISKIIEASKVGLFPIKFTEV